MHNLAHVPCCRGSHATRHAHATVATLVNLSGAMASHGQSVAERPSVFTPWLSLGNSLLHVNNYPAVLVPSAAPAKAHGPGTRCAYDLVRVVRQVPRGGWSTDRVPLGIVAKVVK